MSETGNAHPGTHACVGPGVHSLTLFLPSMAASADCGSVHNSMQWCTSVHSIELVNAHFSRSTCTLQVVMVDRLSLPFACD